ncbi:MAG: universal stress protein [Candidatus Nitrosopumilus sp. bin_68KS]
MNNFKKILVPLDGSKYSKKSLQRACEMVHAFDSQIILIYVVEKSAPVNFLDRKEYLQLLRKYGKKTLSDANDFLSKNGIIGKSLIREGNIVNEIDKVIKEEKCNLVIVGNKGLGTVARFLLGSISNKLAQSSSCSLMIVK